MRRQGLTRIGRIFVEGTLVDRAVKAAARDALILHRRAGVPVVVYRNGRVLAIPAARLLKAKRTGRHRSRQTRTIAERTRT